MRVLGVFFFCWRALVRVTSQTASPTATATATTAASLKLFRGACVLFLKEKVLCYFIPHGDLVLHSVRNVSPQNDLLLF